jgi:hypothetical protein
MLRKKITHIIVKNGYSLIGFGSSKKGAIRHVLRSSGYFKPGELKRAIKKNEDAPGAIRMLSVEDLDFEKYLEGRSDFEKGKDGFYREKRKKTFALPPLNFLFDIFRVRKTDDAYNKMRQ